MKNAATNTRPLLTPLPLNYESINGYLLRLIEVNGYNKLNWIFKNIPAIRHRPHIASGPYLESLSQHLGLQYESLIAIAYVRETQSPTSHVTYFGDKLPLAHSTFQLPRICPVCICESVSHAFWEVKYVTVCPFHEVRLIDKCQKCSKQIDWFRTKSSQCPKCKFDFAMSDIDRATASVTQLTQAMYLSTNFNHSKKLTTSLSGFPIQELRFEKLNNFLQMMHIARHFLVAKELQEQWKSSDQSYSARLNYEYKLVETLTDVLADWPNNLFPIIHKNFNYRNKSGWGTGTNLDYRKSGITSLNNCESPWIFRVVGKAFVEVVENLKRKNILIRMDENLLNRIKSEYESISDLDKTKPQ